MKKTRIISLALVAIMLVMVFAGCSKKETYFISSSADLKNAKIGVQEGTTGDLLVSEEVEGAVISRYKKAVDGAIELKNGKLDAVVLDAWPAQKIVDQMSELTILDENLSEEEYAIAVRKGETELLNSINDTIAEMKKDGTYDALYNYFMEKSGSLPEFKASSFGKEILMGTNAEFEPFEYREGSEIVGFDVEMSRRFAENYGCDLKIVDMAFDSLITALASGKIDFIAAGMSVTEERLQSVDFSEPYFSASQVIIVRKTSVK
ncbi:MAG: transporter substrate-binding domain-containing protein [Clostridiales bacterium]|nr:transporter substrate-binding domain-containing protein [Clostridiales bacterium]